MAWCFARGNEGCNTIAVAVWREENVCSLVCEVHAHEAAARGWDVRPLKGAA